MDESGSASGSGTGSLCGSELGSLSEDGHRRRESNASTDSVYDTESITSSRESLIETSHSLSQVLMSVHIQTKKYRKENLINFSPKLTG